MILGRLRFLIYRAARVLSRSRLTLALLRPIAFGWLFARRDARRISREADQDVVWTELQWRGGHNNIRYATLLPHLDAVCSAPRRYRWDRRWAPALLAELVRGFIRVWDRELYEPAFVRNLSEGFSTLLCTSDWLQQIDHFSGAVVVDDDDPIFTPDHLGALNHPNVLGVITTTDDLSDGLVEAGLRKPCYVVPSGVADAVLDVGRRRHDVGHGTAGSAARHPVVVGHVIPELFVDSEVFETASESRRLRSITFLLEAMEHVWQDDPAVRLRLVGKPSDAVREVASETPQLELVGYVSHDRLHREYASMDIGVYPRALDLGGRHSIKVMEYLAAGLPVVCTDVSETGMAQEVGATLVADTPEEFGRAILRLAHAPELRDTLGRSGFDAASQFTWEDVAERYRVALDRLLTL